MRNIRVCQRNCLQCRVLMAANEQEVLYQCNRDIDCDGIRMGPYPFDAVTQLSLPPGCDRQFDQHVLGEGTVLDAVSAESYGINQHNIHRFMTLCAGCRHFTSEYEKELGEQTLCCDLEEPRAEVSEDEAQAYNQASYFLTRPLPPHCPYRYEHGLMKP